MSPRGDIKKKWGDIKKKLAAEAAASRAEDRVFSEEANAARGCGSGGFRAV